MPSFLAEIGAAEVLDFEQAGKLLARLVARGIVDGIVEPYAGARFLWLEINTRLYPNRGSALLPFVGLASEYEDCEFYECDTVDVRKKIAAEIVKEARDLILDHA